MKSHYRKTAEKENAVAAAFSVLLILGLGAFAGIATYRVFLIATWVIQ